jgi:hypothetical protein
MLNTKQTYLFTKVITTIATIYALAFVIYVVYTQSIGNELDSFTGLAICSNSIAPIKAGAEQSPKKPSRLSNEQKAQFNLSKELKEIIIGLILGDLFIQKDKRAINGNACLRFLQSTIHTDYLDHLYNKFQDYCSAAPKIFNPRPDKRTGKVYSVKYFNTYSLPCFNEYYDLFYKEGCPVQKVIPHNIGELLTPLSLAFWICEDGTFEKLSQRVILCTESFTIDEVEVLINVLNSNWDLKCYKSKRGASFRIAIPRKSLPILHKFCGPHMPAMMLHKIGL